MESSLKKLDFSLTREEFSYLKKETKAFVELLKKKVFETKIDADVFIGGSFAKQTFTKEDVFDVDVFVRFDKKYENLSRLLEKILKKMKKPFKTVHGSRDYFAWKKNSKLIFEVIPVKRIKYVKDARNVTDLSYFHVNYVKKNLSEKMKKEVALAKQFCKAQSVYGAETYINGFSGYALECLIIYYKSFEKMLKELVKIKGKLIIDPAKHFKKKGDIFVEINESKRQGPIILVDPTFRERNVLAALNKETFEKFQDVARKFVKKPSERFFVFKEVDVEKMRKKAKAGEFVHIVLETDRQEGDIAGTKLKKFARFLEREISKYFDIFDKEFIYRTRKKADFYLIVKSKGEVIKKGPFLKREKNVEQFRKRNRNVFEKKGVLYARIRVIFTVKELLRVMWKKDKARGKEMGVVGLEVMS